MYPGHWSNVDRRSLHAIDGSHALQQQGGQPGMAGPGAMVGRVPFGGQFVGHAGMQPGRMPMPRSEMLFLQQQQQQQQQMGPGMGSRPQGNYMMMQPQYRQFIMQQQQQQQQQMQQQLQAQGSMQQYQNTLDVPSMMPGGPMSGGPASLASPGMLSVAHSPGPPSTILPSPVSAPSPGTALNTPGNPGSVGAGNSEEQAYLDKWNQLQKYVEPLKRMINRIDKDEDRQRDLNKMKNLLDILSDSNKRLPYATLLKCETVLEKLEFSSKPGQPSVVPPLSGPSEHMCQQLLDAVANHLKSPTLNHTLQRTFGPAVRALHGPPLRSDSPPAKRHCVDGFDEPSSPTNDDVSDTVLCEIARLHRRFVISLDPSHHLGSKVIHLVCRLEDKKLPSVPPIMVSLPENYPDNSPSCKMLPSHYDSTPFLRKVSEILTMEIKQIPGRYSLTALLNMWDTCVRKACAVETLSV